MGLKLSSVTSTGADGFLDSLEERSEFVCFREEADLLARALGCRLLRTSVKEDVNVAAVFRHLAARCLAELRDPRDYDYFTTPTPHHPNSLTISESRRWVFADDGTSRFSGAFSPSHSSKNHNGTIVLRPNKHKKKKNVLKNACRIL
jgi:Ras-related protein Rab-23